MGLKDYVTAEERLNFKIKNKGNSVLAFTLLLITILPLIILMHNWRI